MDKRLIKENGAQPGQEEGFPGQRIVRLPVATLKTCQEIPIVRSLHSVSLGNFPPARHHLVERPDGIDNNLIMLCAAGHGFLEVAGKKHSVHAGQIALVPRNMPHRYGASGGAPWSKYWVHFDGGHSDKMMAMLQKDPEVFTYNIRDMSEAIDSFESLYHASLKVHQETTLLAMTSALLACILSLARLREDAATRARTADRQILSAVHRIQEQCEEAHNVPQLAKDSGMSEAAFYRRFKHQIGCSPNHFVTRARMQKACRLLDLTSMPINEIAREVGYDDPYYFSRVFCRMMESSPSDYRKSDRSRSKSTSKNS